VAHLNQAISYSSTQSGLNNLLLSDLGMESGSGLLSITSTVIVTVTNVASLIVGRLTASQGLAVVESRVSSVAISGCTSFIREVWICSLHLLVVLRMLELNMLIQGAFGPKKISQV
jgi:hypothetical protein